MNPINLLPKFNQSSKITKGVEKCIKQILETPKIIPSSVHGIKSYNNITSQYSSYDNSKICCHYSNASNYQLQSGLNNFEKYKKDFQKNFTPQKRIEMFQKAANLLQTKYYDEMLASTIVSQNKTIYEAEIDAICELVDFLNFNVHYYQTILDKQPINTQEHINISEYNPLNGFVAAITPFNFTAIGGNLASLPLLFGNSVFWKPSDSSILSNYLFYEIMLEANMPEYILNFTPMEPKEFSNIVTNHQDLAAILFTGSSDVFDNIYLNVSKNIFKYNNYVRLVGETGGKNFHFIHQNISEDSFRDAVKLTIESAFNYSGQKCSSCSRVYIPKSLTTKFIDVFYEEIRDYVKSNETYGVINSKSFTRICEILRKVSLDDDIEIVYGSNCHNYEKYYVQPTLLKCDTHSNFIFHEEFFAPILSIYSYDDKDIRLTMKKCTSNKYGLTGAVFSDDYDFIQYFKDESMNSCGNFYINDKSTGSIVGQQPFGGSNKSGTNDKAGDINLLYRLMNQRNIKINKKIN